MEPGYSTVYMLCGLTGAGKTTTALRLAEAGCQRLSVDQVIHQRFGRRDEDFPSDDYLRLHAQVISELDERLIEILRRRRDVVLDYGREFWTRAGRDRYKQLVDEHGGRWKLIYLQADRELLLERLRERNRRRDADAFHMTEERLDQFIANFEEPDHEAEIVDPQRRPDPSAFGGKATADPAAETQADGTQQ
jgi:predicted kinase